MHGSAAVGRLLKVLLARGAAGRESASKICLLDNVVGSQLPGPSCARNCWQRPWVSRAFSRSSDSFTPTRLYQARTYSTNGEHAFKLVVGLNLAVLVAAQSNSPEIREAFLHHTRASVEALYSGRYYTLATSIISHASAVHCAVNLLVLFALRRFHTLSNKEFLTLYTLGGLGGSIAHTAYMWYDAGGPKYGPEFSRNTPGYLGCSGAVAAITAYKMFQQPLAIQMLVVLPLPVVLLQLFYVCLEVKEKEYFDGQPAKIGGTAVGLLVAVLAALLKARTPLWLQR